MPINTKVNKESGEFDNARGQRLPTLAGIMRNLERDIENYKGLLKKRREQERFGEREPLYQLFTRTVLNQRRPTSPDSYKPQ